MASFFENLVANHWVAFSIALAVTMCIGASIIKIGACFISKGISRIITCTIGVIIMVVPIMLYAEYFKSSFMVVVKCLGIGFGSLIAISILLLIYMIWTERDVNSKRKSKCKSEIVVLCGSIKFIEKMYRVGYELTLKGYIVLYPTLIPEDKKSDTLFSEDIFLLKDIHLDRIRLADIVYIFGENEYIGFDTQKEIGFANDLNKKIIYDIGDKKVMSDDDIRNVMNMHGRDISEELPKMGYSPEAASDMSITINKIKDLPYDDVKTFMENRIGLNDIKDKYDM